MNKKLIEIYEKRTIEFDTVKELRQKLDLYKNWKFIDLKEGHKKDSLWCAFGFKPQKNFILTIVDKKGEKYE